MNVTALEPVDGEAILPLDLLKARVRVVSDDEDADLARMRGQAIDFVERYSGIALARRQFRFTDKQFCRFMPLVIGPVVSVDAIEYTDSTGATVSLSEADWYLGDGNVMAAAATVWPYASGQPGSVRVTFTAGLESAEDEAPMLVAAVEVGVAALFADREKPDWSAAMACADSYRIPGL